MIALLNSAPQHPWLFIPAMALFIAATFYVDYRVRAWQDIINELKNRP